jgi:hypothetical protein
MGPRAADMIYLYISAAEQWVRAPRKCYTYILAQQNNGSARRGGAILFFKHYLSGRVKRVHTAEIKMSIHIIFI